MQAQEKANDSRCADLRSTFETQIAVLRKSVSSASQNAANREQKRHDESMAVLRQAMAVTIAYAVWNSLPKNTATGVQQGIASAVESLIRELSVAVSDNDIDEAAAARQADKPGKPPKPDCRTAEDWIQNSNAIGSCVRNLQKSVQAAWALELNDGQRNTKQANEVRTWTCNSRSHLLEKSANFLRILAWAVLITCNMVRAGIDASQTEEYSFITMPCPFVGS